MLKKILMIFEKINKVSSGGKLDEKQIYTLISTMLLVVFVASPAYASTFESNEANINTVQELHESIVTNNLASLNEEGKLLIDERAIELNVDEGIYNEYVNDLVSLNKGIEEGLMYFDSNLQIKMYSPEVIEDMVYEESLKTLKKDLLMNQILVWCHQWLYLMVRQL